ncbi:hypothetical protein [Burkholderia sp. F1]|uniref:hypothetical protein n=1 Tax=Burkholderia sp. F1 TaxID=3366817 RepID=UPI003D719631
MKRALHTIKVLSTGWIAVVLLLGHGGMASAFSKPKVLPASVEAKWIQTVKQHRTKDGATVSEVLAYAEKMRPDKFKADRFDIGYNGASGAADAVTIRYWVGNQRSTDDAFVDLGYPMSADGHVMPVPSEKHLAVALEGGRKAFLRAVDSTYLEVCRADPDHEPSC